jgi:hypothetical protein
VRGGARIVQSESPEQAWASDAAGCEI